LAGWLVRAGAGIDIDQRAHFLIQINGGGRERRYRGPGVTPTGKTVRTSAMQMFRCSQGKIVESWAARDDLGTLR
jgi:hypothetical protein